MSTKRTTRPPSRPSSHPQRSQPAASISATDAPKLERLTLSISQAALVLSVGESRMYDLVTSGSIPGCFQLSKPGGRWFVPIAGLRAWVALQSAPTQPLPAREEGEHGES